MKTNIYIFIALASFAGCESRSSSPVKNLDEIKEAYSKEIEIYNSKTIHWERVIDSIYKIGSSSKLACIEAIDNLLLVDSTLESKNKAELRFIKGDIYYRIDSLENALSEFAKNYRSPKLLAAEAAVYIKQKKFDLAFSNLQEATVANYDYYWNIGNYFEIIGLRDSAISNYQKLYRRDTLIYKYCNDRVFQLKNAGSKNYEELIFKDRDRKKLL